MFTYVRVSFFVRLTILWFTCIDDVWSKNHVTGIHDKYMTRGLLSAERYLLQLEFETTIGSILSVSLRHYPFFFFQLTHYSTVPAGADFIIDASRFFHVPCCRW